MLRRLIFFSIANPSNRNIFRFVHKDPVALNITERAVEKLKTISRDGEQLRITVEGGGCSGFTYKMSLDSGEFDDDVIVEKDGARVVVDMLSLDYIKGSTIDYTQELMRSAFRITSNPLATQGCSCGASFAPKELP